MIFESALRRQRSSVSSLMPTVSVIDPDPQVRDSLETLIRLEGWRPETFASAEAFLLRPRQRIPSCLVLDAALPSLGGLEVQRRVSLERPHIPIIFIANRSDVRTVVQAMKAGAEEFFIKPVIDDTLVSAIRQSLQRSEAVLDRETELQVLRDRYASLSGRERQVMTLAASGRLNKQIGGELGISECTVKAHRGRVTRKMQSQSLADLVHMAASLGLIRAHSAQQYDADIRAMRWGVATPSPGQFRAP